MIQVLRNYGLHDTVWQLRLKPWHWDRQLLKNFTQIIQLKNTAVDLFNLFRSLSKFSCVIVGPRVLLGRNPIIYISVSQKPAVGFAYNVIRTAFYLFCCLPRKMPTETIVHMWWGLFIPVQKKGNLVSKILFWYCENMAMILTLITRPGNSAKCFWELKCFYRKISAKRGNILG